MATCKRGGVFAKEKCQLAPAEPENFFELFPESLSEPNIFQMFSRHVCALTSAICGHNSQYSQRYGHFMAADGLFSRVPKYPFFTKISRKSWKNRFQSEYQAFLSPENFCSYHSNLVLNILGLNICEWNDHLTLNDVRDTAGLWLAVTIQFNHQLIGRKRWS